MSLLAFDLIVKSAITSVLAFDLIVKSAITSVLAFISDRQVSHYLSP